MTAPGSVSLHALAENNLVAVSPDLLRAMVETFADTLMSARADVLCNAEYAGTHRSGPAGRAPAGRAVWSASRRSVYLPPPASPPRTGSPLPASMHGVPGNRIIGARQVAPPSPAGPGNKESLGR